MADPITALTGAVLRFIGFSVSVMRQGVKAVHQAPLAQYTFFMVGIIFLEILIYEYIFSSVDGQFSILYAPKALDKATLQATLDHGLDLSRLALAPFSAAQVTTILAAFSLRPSLWLAIMLTSMLLSTYISLAYRHGAGRTTTKRQVEQEFWTIFAGVIQIYGRVLIGWLISFSILRLLISHLEFPSGHRMLFTIFAFLPFFLIGLWKIGWDLFVFRNSLDLKTVKHFKSGWFWGTLRFYKTLGLGMLWKINLANTVVRLGGGAFLALATICLELSIMILHPLLPPLLAALLPTLGFLWLAIAGTASVEYTWGSIYAKFWNYDFKELTPFAENNPRPYAPTFSKGKKVQRWHPEMVAPAVIMQQGQITRAPSPLEQKILAKKKKSTALKTKEAKETPALKDLNKSAQEKKPAWALAAKEIAIDLTKPPLPFKPKPQDVAKPPLPPKIKFKW